MVNVKGEVVGYNSLQLQQKSLFSDIDIIDRTGPKKESSSHELLTPLPRFRLIHGSRYRKVYVLSPPVITFPVSFVKLTVLI